MAGDNALRRRQGKSYLYECDPDKNTECSKEACFVKGGECHLTSYPEYASKSEEVRTLHELMGIKEALEKLRHFTWLRDIPSPTVPEYREHHKDIQEILGEIDAIISNVDDLIIGWGDDCK